VVERHTIGILRWALARVSRCLSHRGSYVILYVHPHAGADRVRGASVSDDPIRFMPAALFVSSSSPPLPRSPEPATAERRATRPAAAARRATRPAAATRRATRPAAARWATRPAATRRATRRAAKRRRGGAVAGTAASRRRKFSRVSGVPGYHRIPFFTEGPRREIVRSLAREGAGISLNDE
jgi:hypothetical protein